jgi:glycosyltransferase involved in cell wall biosynthesis
MTLDRMPLVSVIIPCYKHELFLERTLDSVAAQTYPNLEVVIVDDCSPDGSAIEIRRVINSDCWKARFPERTQFYPLAKNKGAHHALNYGIHQAKGSIISLLNSDDKYHPERVNSIVEVMQEGHEFVFTGVEYIDAEDHNVTSTNPRAKSYFQAQTNIAQFPSVGFACLTFNVGISTGNFAFTKSLYERVGAFKHYLHCHDWDFLLQSLIQTEPYFLKQDLYYYRFHGSNTFESLHQAGVEESAELLSNYFSKVNASWSPNPIAPSKLNWAAFYDLFVQWYHLGYFQSA